MPLCCERMKDMVEEHFITINPEELGTDKPQIELAHLNPKSKEEKYDIYQTFISYCPWCGIHYDIFSR